MGWAVVGWAAVAVAMAVVLEAAVVVDRAVAVHVARARAGTVVAAKVAAAKVAGAVVVAAGTRAVAGAVEWRAAEWRVTVRVVADDLATETRVVAFAAGALVAAGAQAACTCRLGTSSRRRRARRGSICTGCSSRGRCRKRRSRQLFATHSRYGLAK